MAWQPTDIPLHDTNYVIGHFHYLVAPRTIFVLFAGVYYWFPKITGRFMNEPLGKIHFFGSLYMEFARRRAPAEHQSIVVRVVAEQFAWNVP